MLFLWYVPLLIVVVLAGEDAIDVCQNCSCTASNAQMLTIQCANKGLHHFLSQWPPHNNTIIAYWSGNNIPTLEPLPKTDAFVEIVLSNCQIQYLKPNLFVDSKNIKFLDLSYNLLTGEEVTSEKFRGPYNDSVDEPIALEHLNLSYNRIHSFNKNVFEHMPNLKILDLEGNKFNILDLHTQLALNSVKTLQSLNLANNKLTELIKGAIEGHDNLSELNLSNNEMDFVPSSLTHIGKSLQILILDGNPIFEMIDETFLGLGNVTVLSLNNLKKLKYINANVFEPMHKLRKLSLCDNFALKDIDREAFGINQTLEEFYLNNNDLYRLDYKLLPWSKLRVFEFKENPFDCSCDLYNITNSLPKDITRTEDGPYCRNPIHMDSIQVTDLTIDICTQKSVFKVQKEYIQYHFSVLRMVLIVLSVILMMTAFLATVLGYISYRKYHRNRNYPFISQILYNPLSSNS